MTLREIWPRERGFAHIPGVCEYCGVLLVRCRRCGGGWRRQRSACGDCGLGVRCPTHGREWFVH
ncbi:hypothetical protein [Actinomadura sp. DC4]|uniref:hypothetical protein n=1 Tax=Actinomadura sp. DC4 TaxID=3055069 RepID=UPI0025AEF331|nr:hypothetical protein [Actinomadura sp. DC4]MDN3353855.1 hypothetical protein [Actinomadura sp. DC4]